VTKRLDVSAKKASSDHVADTALQNSPHETDRPISTLLASHQMPMPATFSYQFLDMPFDVGVRRDSDGGAQLVVRGKLGNLPYSAESVDARSLLSSVIDAGIGMPAAEITLDRKQSIVVRGTMKFQSMPSPATVAAAAAAITVAVKPICELIAKCRRMLS
jgi:hypothetical protein